jgi:hypothetical protein
MLQWKSNKYYIFWVCVCGLRYPAWNAHAAYCHLRPVRLHKSFSHYLTKGKHFPKKLLNMKCVFWFSLQHFFVKHLILRRTERDMIKMYICLHVKYPLFLSDFNETWIFVTDFWKILKYQISWKSIQWEPICAIRTDRLTEEQTERQTWQSLIFAFWNFANSSQNVQMFLYSGGTHFEHRLEHMLFSGFRGCNHRL